MSNSVCHPLWSWSTRVIILRGEGIRGGPMLWPLGPNKPSRIDPDRSMEQTDPPSIKPGEYLSVESYSSSYVCIWRAGDSSMFVLMQSTPWTRIRIFQIYIRTCSLEIFIYSIEWTWLKWVTLQVKCSCPRNQASHFGDSCNALQTVAASTCTQTLRF